MRRRPNQVVIALAVLLAWAACRAERLETAGPSPGAAPSVATPVPLPPPRSLGICGDELPASALNDPQALGEIVAAVQLRSYIPDPEPECTPGEPCVSPCDEDTQCHRCEMLETAALYRLAKLGTPAAAAQMASLILDPRMEWDAGRGLTVSDAAAQLGPPMLPLLRPHVATSRHARMIVECIERGKRCL